MLKGFLGGRTSRAQATAPAPATASVPCPLEVSRAAAATWPAFAPETDGPLGRGLAILSDKTSGMLRDAYGNVAATAAAASKAAVNIGWVSHDVIEIASSTTAIAGAVEEMAATTAQMSESALLSASLAQQGRVTADACLSGVGEAGLAMEAIANSANRVAGRLDALEAIVREIGGMAVSIEKISGQTNLLALNATIEAARAGQAGRGFAVVASEVKALSAQTAAATQQIQSMLAALSTEAREIRSATTDSLATVKAGGEAVARVSIQAEAVGRSIGEGAASVQSVSDMLADQRQATQEIARNVQTIAEKAAKTRDEIAGLDTVLVQAERDALDALAAAPEVPGGIGPQGLPATLGSIRRRLSSMLLGRPDDGKALIGQLEATLSSLSGGDRPTIQAVIGNASTTVGHLGRGAHPKAIESYVAFDAAVDALLSGEAPVALPLAA